MPDWLRFDPANGNMWGVPDKVGTYPIKVRVLDSDGTYADALRTVVVTDAKRPASTTADVVSKLRSSGKWDGPAYVDMTGLTGPYTWTTSFSDPQINFWNGGTGNVQGGAWTWGLPPGYFAGNAITGTDAQGNKRTTRFDLDVAAGLVADFKAASACVRTGESYATGPVQIQGVRARRPTR